MGEAHSLVVPLLVLVEVEQKPARWKSRVLGSVPVVHKTRCMVRVDREHQPFSEVFVRRRLVQGVSCVGKEFLEVEEPVEVLPDVLILRLLGQKKLGFEARCALLAKRFRKQDVLYVEIGEVPLLPGAVGGLLDVLELFSPLRDFSALEEEVYFLLCTVGQVLCAQIDLLSQRQILALSISLASSEVVQEVVTLVDPLELETVLRAFLRLVEQVELRILQDHRPFRSFRSSRPFSILELEVRKLVLQFLVCELALRELCFETFDLSDKVAELAGELIFELLKICLPFYHLGSLGSCLDNFVVGREHCSDTGTKGLGRVALA